MRPGVDTTDVRRSFREVLNRVAVGKERLVVTRHGRELMAMVPLEDMQLLEDLEDRMDLEEARAALEEAAAQGTSTWKEVKASLGL